MGHGTFATVIDCIDGRTKHAVIDWVKAAAQVDFVDMITEPGPDKAVTQGAPDLIAALQRKVSISLQAHHSRYVAVAAHAECAGNPVSDEEHKRQVVQSAQQIARWGLGVPVVGLWVNHDWQVEQICAIPADQRLSA